MKVFCQSLLHSCNKVCEVITQLSQFSSDTGLLILSKHPVLESETLFYRDRNPKEIFSKKGALRAKIQLPHKTADGKDYFYVITTHLDVGINSDFH